MEEKEGEYFWRIPEISNMRFENERRRSRFIIKQLNNNKKFKLTYDIEWVEEFPATVNSDECNSIISQAADELNLEIINPDIPFPWSEDFGRYTQLCKGAFFGIGAGVDSPQLHNPNYDFPDSIIQTGVDMFSTILKLLGK